MESVISIWLRPHAKLKNEIFQIIKNFSNKYKVYYDVRGYKGPHITILEIHSSKRDFETVGNIVKNISTKFRPFKLKINGVGYFTGLDELGKRNFVIYLKVNKNRKLIALKKLVDAKFPNNSARYKSREFIPHITITHRELDKKNFYRALKEYKNLDFARNFTVNELVVSKYDEKTKKPQYFVANLHTSTEN